MLLFGQRESTAHKELGCFKVAPENQNIPQAIDSRIIVWVDEERLEKEALGAFEQRIFLRTPSLKSVPMFEHITIFAMKTCLVEKVRLQRPFLQRFFQGNFRQGVEPACARKIGGA